ncbi:Lrp/AsnC family transcriptional regulator [Aeromonas hydrophila]|uniref:Lrp/AsnC family transcriptional regulator n=1 Tax=Aeromonas hydrophila TaxID=644 RepID=UPI00366F9A23
MTDKFDLLILAELQQDARLPIPELAHRVGLSAPACYRRVRARNSSNGRWRWWHRPPWAGPSPCWCS